jgi:geranylgeranyl pyrophosphate synthase
MPGFPPNGELTQDVSAFEYSPDVQRYLDRITGKTASLFGTAAEGGAMVAGVDVEQVEALRLYGLRLGIAFQIVDDILDFTGDEWDQSFDMASTYGRLRQLALAYATKHHDQQVRRGTRSPYLTRHANVAVILARYGSDEDTAVAGILLTGRLASMSRSRRTPMHPTSSS